MRRVYGEVCKGRGSGEDANKETGDCAPYLAGGLIAVVSGDYRGTVGLWVLGYGYAKGTGCAKGKAVERTIPTCCLSWDGH